MTVSSAAPSALADSEFLAALDAASDAASQLHRPDLSEQLNLAGDRILRPATVVCVVGEFKQGKSSVVNSLLGQFVCPTDDDLATSAVTVVRFGGTVRVLVHRRIDGHDTVEEIAPAQVGSLVTEQGDPAVRAHVERVEIEVPNPALAGGLVLVDTPGVGGLSVGQAAATLAYLPFADGLIFATDATSELSAPEIALLRTAVERCPTALMALTKVDIAANWRRIAEIDRNHLDATGEKGRVPIIPVSSVLRQAALRLHDAALDARSGYPALAEEISRRIIGPAKKSATELAAVEGRAVVAQLSASLKADLQLLEHPEGLEMALQDLRAAQARLDHLRGPGSRWSMQLGDRMADLGAQVNYTFRAAMRTASREMDEGIESINTPEEWDRLGQELQTHVAEAVAEVFATLERGVQELRRDLATTLMEEAGIVDADARPRGVDVAALWTSALIAEDEALASQAAGQTVAGLRGAQSGLSLFSLLGQFVPRGAVALLMASPLTLGIGIAFAGASLRDSHRRKIALRRQKAKAAGRQFLDDVQFEVGNELADTIRVRQRDLRDEFAERVTNALKVNSDAAARAQANAQQAEAERGRRAGQIRAGLERLAAIDRALAVRDVAGGMNSNAGGPT